VGEEDELMKGIKEKKRRKRGKITNYRTLFNRHLSEITRT